MAVSADEKSYIGIAKYLGYIGGSVSGSGDVLARAPLSSFLRRLTKYTSVFSDPSEVSQVVCDGVYTLIKECLDFLLDSMGLLWGDSRNSTTFLVLLVTARRESHLARGGSAISISKH